MSYCFMLLTLLNNILEELAEVHTRTKLKKSLRLWLLPAEETKLVHEKGLSSTTDLSFKMPRELNHSLLTSNFKVSSQIFCILCVCVWVGGNTLRRTVQKQNG